MKRSARQLTIDQLRQLDDWLHERIEKLEEPALAPPTRPGREIIEQRQIGKKTFQLELIRCGKAACRCAKGKGHGPYWYSYWSAGGKTRSAYVGKELKAG